MRDAVRIAVLALVSTAAACAGGDGTHRPVATIFTVTITGLGTGSGVVGWGTGSCAVGPGVAPCRLDVAATEPPTSVTLNAVADDGSTFAGFGEPCSGDSSCGLVITGPTSVTARFDLLPVPSPATCTIGVSAGPHAVGEPVVMTFTARDLGGTALPGLAVSFLLDGAPPGAPAVTDAEAVARFTVIATVSGSHDVSVVAGNVVLATATVELAPGPPTALTFATGPEADQTAGGGFDIVVEVHDAFGNLTPSAAVVTLDLRPDGQPGGQLWGTTTVAASAGVASFPGVWVARAWATYVLEATAAGLAGATSAPFSVAPAAPASLMVVADRLDAVAGDTLRPVLVRVIDAFGNAAVSATASVVLQLTGGAAGATLLGTTVRALSDGAVLFDDLAVPTAGAGYVLVASSLDVNAASTSPFAIATAAADALTSAVTVSPALLTAGDAAMVQAVVRDGGGNPVAFAAVTFHMTGTGNQVPWLLTTDSTGTVAGLVSSTRAETKTITVWAGAVALGVQPEITFVAGALDPTGSSMTASSSTAPADGTAVQLKIQLGDEWGNPVAGAAVTVSSSNAANITQPTSVTGADGTATAAVGTWTVGPQTLSAYVGGTLLAQTLVDFTVPSCPPGKLRFTSTSPQPYPLGAGPAALVLVDLDGDGRPDVVVANHDSEDVSVLMNLGGGVFGAQERHSSWVHGAPWALTTADLDGNGSPDLIVTSNELDVLLGDGNGGFGAPVGYTLGIVNTPPVTADIDGDGNTDVIFAWGTFESGGSVTLRRGEGDGSFAADTTFNTSPWYFVPMHLAVGDLTGDGRPEVVVADQVQAQLAVLSPLDGGTLARVDLNSRVDALAVGDFDADGLNDIVVAGESGLGLLLNRGSARFDSPVPSAGSAVVAMAIGDMNGDGLLDVLTATQVGTLEYYENRGGSFEVYAFDVGATATAVAVGDLDGDERPDVALVTTSGLVAMLGSCVP